MKDITIQSKNDLQYLINNDGVVNYNLTIRGSNIENLEGIIRINGDLILIESPINDLGELEYIGGTFHLGNYYTKSRLEIFNCLLRIKGSLNFRYSNLKSLGSIIEIGGNLNLRDTECLEFGGLKRVGGNLLLPKLFKEKVNLDGIQVDGKITYWNNNKNQFKPVANPNLVEAELPIPFWQFKYLSESDQITYETVEIVAFYGWFKNKFQNNIYIDLKGNNNYVFYLLLEYKKDYYKTRDIETLKRRFIKLSIHYPITHPYTNQWLIEIFDELQLYEDLYIEIIQNKEFVDLNHFFYATYKSNKPEIDIQYLLKITKTDSLTEFGKKNIKELIKFYSLNVNNNELIKSGKLETLILNTNKIDHIFIAEGAFETFNKLQCELERSLRDAENDYRISINAPKIGEGWISETELYYKIKTDFSQYTVIHHGKPEWLGRQHLDIYIEELNIGIEYMGKQHYEAIDFFGGEESLLKTKERDQRKVEKCELNNCKLIIVDENYNYSILKMQVLTLMTLK